VKRLIVCCDGTWNTPDQERDDQPTPTNVVRLHNAVVADRDDGIEQKKYYHSGVGTEGSLLSRTAGGMWGEGLDKNVESAYAWIATNYQPGDAIYLFGFSRGAYTARVVGGVLGRVGMPDLQGLSVTESWNRIRTAFRLGYRDRQDRANWGDGWQWQGPSIPVEFIGVWDTVGALGVPDDLALLNLFDRSKRARMIDDHLGEHVKHGRHALAIDEERASFTPTLWTDPKTNQPINCDDRIKQLWFPGVHSDAGGGYPSTGLSDIALKWMIDEAEHAGLKFSPGLRAQVKPDPRGTLHDSVRGVFKALKTRPRNIPDLGQTAWFHPDALERHAIPPIAQAPYRPSRKLGVGPSDEITIYARRHWNDTGLYLEAGSYVFTAEGEWMDRSIRCGPGGTDDGHFQLAEIFQLAGTLLGKLEGVFQSATGNQSADFIATRRIESAPWFSLVGVVANDGGGVGANPHTDGSPTPHQHLPIGKGPFKLDLARGGYLYAFANDAWHFYENNRGSVTLRIQRTA